jgi:hypothetical protein
MPGKCPEIFCSCLGARGRGGGMDPMNRNGGLNKAWCNMRRNVAKGVQVIFLIYLR